MSETPDPAFEALLEFLKRSRGLDVPITALFDEFPPSTVRPTRL